MYTDKKKNSRLDVCRDFVAVGGYKCLANCYISIAQDVVSAAAAKLWLLESAHFYFVAFGGYEC